MRVLSFRLIVALIIGVTLVSIASSWYEVQSQENALQSDLERKAEVLGESLARTAELYLETGDRPGLEQLVGRFSNRDHLLGIGVYGHDGSALVLTPGLSTVLPGTSQPLRDASLNDHSQSKFTRLGFRRVYVLSLPLYAANKGVTGRNYRSARHCVYS